MWWSCAKYVVRTWPSFPPSYLNNYWILESVNFTVHVFHVLEVMVITYTIITALECINVTLVGNKKPKFRNSSQKSICVWMRLSLLLHTLQNKSSNLWQRCATNGHTCMKKCSKWRHPTLKMYSFHLTKCIWEICDCPIEPLCISIIWRNMTCWKDP